MARNLSWPPRYIFNGIGFYSLSEAVCGTLMEIFIPGYRIVEGETFQVPISANGAQSGCSVDFLVHNVLFEFHAIRLMGERGRFGDFSTLLEYRSYWKELDKIGRNTFKRDRLIRETKRRLAGEYFNRRRKIIDQDSTYAGCELVVATDSNEFYDLVIRRFNPKFCPTRPEFQDIHAALLKAIAGQSALEKREARRRAA